MLEIRAQEANGQSDLTAKIRSAITSGRFMPNERLIEADLARAFDTNRANVRIALAMLDQEGLVIRERNRGARVRLVTDQEAIEIAEARQAIEAMVARQAAEQATEKDRAALRAVMTEMQVAFTRQDLVQFSQLNANLHRTIQTIANNTTANRLLQTLKSQVVRLQYRAIFLPDRVTKSFAEHGKIVDAICANDGAAAEMAMREHLCEVRDALRQAIQTARSARL